MNNSTENQAKPNLEYGNGIFRRRILVYKPKTYLVTAELEDTNHGFRVHLEHDGETITDIKAEMLRFPFTTCPDAPAALQAFVGCKLATNAASLRPIAKPQKNCTHLYDLATLAMAHTARDESKRVYDIAVNDEVDGVTSASISCNGTEVHHWHIAKHKLLVPETLAGMPLMSGFYRWVTRSFSGNAFEAADMLQRGYFVAQTRRYDYKNSVGRPAKSDHISEDACHSYNANVVDKAFLVEDVIRDFTDTPELLLKFV